MELNIKVFETLIFYNTVALIIQPFVKLKNDSVARCESGFVFMAAKKG